MQNFSKIIVHITTRIRQYQSAQVHKFAKDKKKLKILELGSGKAVKGKYIYSFEKEFDSSNEFLKTDIQKSFGHKVLDATKMNFNQEFDIILCLNVLEHVPEFQKAVNNIHKALKKNGKAIIAVPFIYPLHDEPGDFWRFTEHNLRLILKDFKSVKIEHNGMRRFPFSYFVEVKK